MRLGTRRLAAGIAAAALVTVPALSIAAPDKVVGIVAAVPEPSAFALFLIGIVGLFIGRRSSRSRGRFDDRDA